MAYVSPPSKINKTYIHKNQLNTSGYWLVKRGGNRIMKTCLNSYSYHCRCLNCPSDDDYDNGENQETLLS